MDLSKWILDDFNNIEKSGVAEIFTGKTIVITGATGYIGSWLLRFFLGYNKKRTEKNQCNVIALVRNKGKLFDIVGNKYCAFFEVVEHDFSTEEDIAINQPIDYIIHTAAVTTSKDMITYPVETIKTTVLGTEKILNLARNKKCKGMVYLSSMEVYGEIEGENEHRYTEDELGFVDLKNVRSCYPESKRLAECLCKCYSQEYQVPVRIARLAQTFGTGILEKENRIFAQLVDCAIKASPFIMHTSGKTYGNYVYICDAVKAIFLLLEKGSIGETYTICNEESTMQVCEMVKMVSSELEGIHFEVVQEANHALGKMYAKDTGLRLSSEKMRSLGWNWEFGLKETYMRMIKEKKEQKGIE